MPKAIRLNAQIRRSGKLGYKTLSFIPIYSVCSIATIGLKLGIYQPTTPRHHSHIVKGKSSSAVVVHGSRTIKERQTETSRKLELDLTVGTGPVKTSYEMCGKGLIVLGLSRGAH